MPLNTGTTYHAPPPFVAIFFANIHTAKMYNAMRGHFEPYMLGSGCLHFSRPRTPPPPPNPAPRRPEIG